MGELEEEETGIVREEERHDALCLIYLQHFSSSAGHEILADLKRSFYDGVGIQKPNETLTESALVDRGHREVIEHIVMKMTAVNKRKAAEAVFEADCI